MSLIVSFGSLLANTATATAAEADDVSDLKLPELKYSYAALQPHISERTMKIHHDKHHAKYVDTTKAMIKDTPLGSSDLVTIIRKAHADKNQNLFNNAAQSYNHALYWKCMKPNGGGSPSGTLAKLIDKNFGSYEKFKEIFAAAGNTQFGSGWAWLVLNKDGSLKVTKSTGADNPLTEDGARPLLTMDVWVCCVPPSTSPQQYYYLTHKNDRNAAIIDMSRRYKRVMSICIFPII